MAKHTLPSISLGVQCGLLLTVLTGMAAYAVQNRHGLAVTGMYRDVSWGLYISQFTFAVGIAASSVVVLVPHYVHRAPDGGLVFVGEALAVAALIEAFAFVFVDLGRPSRLLGLLVHASPSSVMFWDVLLLTTYLLLCAAMLAAQTVDRSGTPGTCAQRLALASIPFALAIHIVTAMLYSGLAARVGWMSALLAPRFLATAFASGAALLLLIATSRCAAARFTVATGTTALLTNILSYALLAALLFTGLEAFTAGYSRLPPAAHHLHHLLDFGASGLGWWTLLAHSLLIAALVLLLVPRARQRAGLVRLASAAALGGVFIEKGLLFVPSGFTPSPFGDLTSYRPSAVEVLVTAGIHALGALVFLALLRIGLARHPTSPHIATETNKRAPRALVTAEKAHAQLRHFQ